GNAWEQAGQVWYDTLTGGLLSPDTDFKSFAAATLTMAGQRYGARSPEWHAVSNAWAGVGVAV
ncbi:MAG: M4 family metallopeptidase, partial [Streptosporangiaceae bacterium]